MATYRVVLVSKVREFFVVEADDEDAAITMVTMGYLNPIVSEPIPETGEVELVEEV